MLFSNPVPGVDIRPDRTFYPHHPNAVFRPADTRAPLVTHDFGPSTVELEPRVVWRGGESNIFGRRIPPGIYKNFHRAIDITKGGSGDDVLAAARGTVTLSYLSETDTEIVVVNHGMVGGHRYDTLYAHLDPRLVKAGDHVEAGTVIGRLGNTGQKTTGPHLHFAVRKDGRPVDPWRRLRQNATVDPDAPASVVTPPDDADPPLPEHEDAPDGPIPASDKDYVAGQTAIIGNVIRDANVRDDADLDAEIIRTIPGGTQEAWLPTCWVIGDMALGSNLWLTRWFKGRWEFTHEANVVSVK